MNLKIMLMGSRPLVACAVVLAAGIVGCGGGETPPPATPENPPAAAGDGPTGTAEEAQVSGDVTADDFEEPLGNYGTWMDDPRYGRIWQPADDVAGADFAPYASDGSWVANEDAAGGWVYQSRWDTEFGWATYHYGRWVDHDDYGWVWIPGVEWAPAWVEWRYGGGYVGFVPAGPEGYVWPENRWTFVEERHFGDPGGVWSVRVAPERVHTVFVAAAPIAISAGARFSVGPAFGAIRAAGGNVRTAHHSAPNRAAVHAAGKASAAKATTAGRPHPQPGGTAQATVRRGPKAGTKTSVPVRTPVASRSNAGAAPAHGGPAPAHHDPAAHPSPANATVPAHHEATREPARPAATTMTPTHEPAHPAPVNAAKPKPQPEAAPAKPKAAPAKRGKK
jgi:hypothetical protein